MKELVYATQNSAKLDHLQSILGDKYKIISLKDLGIDSQAEEDGIYPKENALKKARYCFQKTGKPSLSMDFGFFIEGLAENEQPGPNVKRIIPISRIREPADEEVLEYYIGIIKRLGGKASAYWIRAFAYVSDKGEYVEEAQIPKVLIDTPSTMRVKGYPMTSIQIDPITNKYECEMTDGEKKEAHKIADEAFMKFIDSHSGKTAN